MIMEILLIVISFIILVGGIVGCFLPMLPGPPLAYAGLLLMHFTTEIEFSTTFLIVALLLVIVLQVLDYITPILGNKYSGGTSYGNRGCVAGTILGLFFMPWGIIVGPFAGAVIGELLGGRELPKALKAGLGTFFGVVLGVVLKVFLCLYFLYKLIVAL